MTKRTRASDQLAELKRATGETSIRQGSSDDWLMRLGVLIDLDLSRWRAQVSVSRLDLGLPAPVTDADKKVFKELIVLGSKRLAPPWYYEDFGSIDSGVRAFVRDHSFVTALGQFVAVGEYLVVKEGIAKFKARHDQVVARVEKEWDEITTWRRAQFAALAATAYDQLKGLNSPVLATNGKVSSRAAFVAGYVTNIESLVPPLEQVMESFGFSVGLTYIPLPSHLAADQMEREKIEAKRALAQLIVEKRQALVTARAAAEQERLQDKSKRARQKADQTDDAFRSRADQRREAEQLVENVELATLTARNAALDVMHADIMAPDRSVARAKDFVRSIQIQQVERILTVLHTASASIATQNDNLIGPMAAGLRNAIDTYQASGLAANTSVDGKISSLNTLLALKPIDRTAGSVRSLIDAIITAAETSLKILKKGKETK